MSFMNIFLSSDSSKISKMEVVFVVIHLASRHKLADLHRLVKVGNKLTKDYPAVYVLDILLRYQHTFDLCSLPLGETSYTTTCFFNSP